MWKSLISTGQQATRATRLQLSKTTASTISTPFSTTAIPKKEWSHDLLDREALNPERSETTKSSTDGEVASHPSAFDPSKTSPESEHEATAEESRREGKDDPLNMSPANKDVSAWRGPTEGGPVRNKDREASSTPGATKKNRGIHVKEDGTHVSYRD
ncbi:unnamed protein product [Penicillium salamii]|uniref:Uncharacterized protein n=1 Tax=Penicillium salamii TaxID=1612424 RepID=A0A9W4J387_9EURO|nr:unnamed protein product [Penicillium salamii]CAG8011840.1 unnamed protein product [Penicillium salamii]CAG8020332.1 unnamed protein product [Penicillium salamii]CAG8121397.1 unnamed protein product [Penicillium salamii]CAG8152766.1 unnamed protein product [Penicillium salamii]